LRIGLFTEAYDPVINGVTTSVKTLAAELRLCGHSAVLVAPGYPRFVDTDPDVRRLPSFRTVFNRENPFAWPPIGPMLSTLARLEVDLVHTQQPFGMGLHGARVARRLGVPLISTFHTLYHEYTHYFPLIPRPTLKKILSRHLRRYYSACDSVIVPSKAAGNRLVSIGVAPEKLSVVPTGVPDPPRILPVATAEARRRLGLENGLPIVLYVGRLAREKNLELLIDAFAPLAGRAVLVIVGSGPHRTACEQHVRTLDLGNWVRFPGFLSRGELSPVYATASVFAFPSGTETQGVVLSEAQSHGLPCVVVNEGGGPEFVRDGVDALVVEPRRETFRVALEALLFDPSRRRALALAARESPLRPTPEGMARRVIEIYQEARRLKKDRAAEGSQ
jgi:glycosyltransferase involved in cell wall biosynthesis